MFDVLTGSVWEKSIGGRPEVHFSPDSRWLVLQDPVGILASVPQQAEILDAATGKEIKLLSNNPLEAPRVAAFDATGSRLILCFEKTASIRATASGQELARIEYPDPATVAKFSADGKLVATGHAPSELDVVDGTWARVFEAATGEKVSSATVPAWVNDLSFSPDGRFVATGNQDNSVSVFQTRTGRQISLSRNHRGPVMRVTFSADAEVILAESSIGSMRVLAADDGSTVVGGDSLASAALSADSKYLATFTYDRRISVFERSSGRLHEVSRLTTQAYPRAVDFSHDGVWLVVADRDGLQVVENKPEGKIMSYGEVGLTAAAISPAGRLLAVAGRGSPSIDLATRIVSAARNDNSLHVFDLTTGNEVFRIPVADIAVGVAFSSSGSVIGYTTTAGSYVVDLDTKKELVNSTSGIAGDGAVAFTSRDQYLIDTGSQRKRIVNAVSRQDVFSPDIGENVALAFSKDGKWFATGGDGNTLHLFSATNGKELWRAQQDHPISAVAFSQESDLIASGSKDGTTRLFHLDSGKEILRTRHGAPVAALAFSSDSRYIVSAIGQPLGEITVYRDALRPGDLMYDACVRLQTGHFTPAEWKQYLGEAAYRDSCASVRSQTRSSVSSGVLPLAKVEESDVRDPLAMSTGIAIHHGPSIFSPLRTPAAPPADKREFSEHRGQVTSVEFSPDGKYFVSTSLDQTAVISEVASGRKVHTLSGHTQGIDSAAFDPKGLLVVTGSLDNTTIVWNVLTGKKVRTLAGHTGAVTTVAISPDGTVVATGSADKTIRLWTLRGAAAPIVISGHREALTSVAFGPTGRNLASIGTDHMPGLWDVSTGLEARAAKLGRDEHYGVFFTSPQKELFAFMALKGTDIVWFGDTGEIGRLMKYREQTSAAAFGQNHKLMAFASEDSVQLVDIDSGKDVRKLKGPGGAISAVAFSPDGHLVAAGTSQGKVLVWSAPPPNCAVTASCAAR